MSAEGHTTAPGAAAASATPSSATESTVQSSVVRGQPKSHRGWKKVQTKKSSLASRPSTGAARNAQSSAFKARHAQRAALLQAKAVAKSDADARAEVKQAERTRLEERKRRREENQYKSSKFQVVTDPEKLKSMSKKQLRMIKKTRVTERGTIEFVSPYSK